MRMVKSKILLFGMENVYAKCRQIYSHLGYILKKKPFENNVGDGRNTGNKLFLKFSTLFRTNLNILSYVKKHRQPQIKNHILFMS